MPTLRAKGSDPPRRVARRTARHIERPPAHWFALALILFALLLLLFAQGLSTHLTGHSGTPTPPRGPTGSPHSPTGSPHSPGGSPPGQGQVLSSQDILLGTRRGHLLPHTVRPGRRIALTFDDGPDPTWTPRIAATLRELGVTATFFEVGDRVTRDPAIARSLAREGFEIGNHTFNHVNLTGLPGWQRELQISLAESAIAGAADLRPRLIRPPYSSTPMAVTKADARAYLALARHGYLIALANYDSEDWRRPGVDQIVRNATPPAGAGGVILFHDGGGNRSQTVAALRRLVPRLRKQGFRFVSYSTFAGLTRAQVDLPASSAQHLRGELLIDSLAVARGATAVLVALLIPIAVLAVLRALVLVALARRHAGEYRGRRSSPVFAPPVSIVVPAYDEAGVIALTVRSLAASDYPRFEVIVVDDGSKDGTADIVERLALENVRVLREPNSGKPSALNAGVAAARHALIVTVDADTLFEPATLRRLVAPFVEEGVGAVAGNTKVGNRKGLLGRWQHIDYVMGFNLDRRLYDILRCMPTVPGAIGAFRRAALQQIGFFSSATLAEDTDVTIALGRAGWRVVYVEDARAFTEAPATLSALWRQRYRWSYGTMQAVWKHKGALTARREGRIGRIGIPYLLLFQVVLPLLAPLIDVCTIYGVLFLDPVPVLGYWLAFNALTIGLAAYAFRLDGESLRVLWAMPLQQLVYRQLMYLVVIQSVISALRGLRLRWQHLERTGEVELAS